MFDRQSAPGDEIDVTDAEHVAWIRASRDPSLWHQATMADVVARGAVASGIVVPHALLDRPFPRERRDDRFDLVDGDILLT